MNEAAKLPRAIALWYRRRLLTQGSEYSSCAVGSHEKAQRFGERRAFLTRPRHSRCRRLGWAIPGPVEDALELKLRGGTHSMGEDQDAFGWPARRLPESLGQRLIEPVKPIELVDDLPTGYPKPTVLERAVWWMSVTMFGAAALIFSATLAFRLFK